MTGRRLDISVYNEAAGHWWQNDTRWLRSLHSLVPARMQIFDPLVTDWRGKTVLDIGCGGGFMSEALAQRGAHVTGIDPAQHAIAAARQHAQASYLDIDYHVGYAEQLPFKAHSFDHILCVDVLEHVGDLHIVLAEAARVLRPGGLFMFDTINSTWIARFAMITLAENLLKLLPKGTHDPKGFITPDVLRDAFEANSLSPGKFSGLGPRSLSRRLDPVFGPIPGKIILYAGHAKRTA